MFKISEYWKYLNDLSKKCSKSWSIKNIKMACQKYSKSWGIENIRNLSIGNIPFSEGF